MKLLINQAGFLIALQYVRPEQTTSACSDILDGTEAKKQRKKMKKRYNVHMKNFPDKACTEISLIISQFYDGAQVSKREFKDF